MERDEFVGRYEPVVRDYLVARWRFARLSAEVDDAVQDVLLQCLRPDGVLDGARERCREGFRLYLFGVARNVARAVERRPRRTQEASSNPLAEHAQMADDEETPSRVFDRSWARAVLREGAQVMERRASAEGPDAMRRVALLTLRFEREMPVRDIARLWQVDAKRVHTEYARARREFKRALHEVLEGHNPEAAQTLASEWELLREALA